MQTDGAVVAVTGVGGPGGSLIAAMIFKTVGPRWPCAVLSLLCLWAHLAVLCPVFPVHPPAPSHVYAQLDALKESVKSSAAVVKGKDKVKESVTRFNFPIPCFN
jgi:hypothetical protein